LVITDIQAQHYLFEITHEADLGERLFRRFQTAAEIWLQVEHSEKPDGRTLWTGTEAEHEIEEAIEGILSSFAGISLFYFPRSRRESLGKNAEGDSEN
jgi:hypothetical protein